MTENSVILPAFSSSRSVSQEQGSSFQGAPLGYFLVPSFRFRLETVRLRTRRALLRCSVELLSVELLSVECRVLSVEC